MKLGDLMFHFTRLTGIKYLADLYNHLSRSDYRDWEAFRNAKTNTITHDEYVLICTLHSDYYEHKMYRPSKCCGQKTLNKWVKELNEIYDNGL